MFVLLREVIGSSISVISGNLVFNSISASNVANTVSKAPILDDQ